MRFLKLKIKTHKSDELISRWCGISSRKLYQTMREKLSERQEEIEDLIDESEWDNAELFVKSFLRSMKELSEDKETLYSSPVDPHGDFDVLKRAREYCAVRERIMATQEERHKIYCRGFEAGKYSEKKSDKREENYNRVIQILGVIQCMLSSKIDAEIINRYIESLLGIFDQRIAGA